MSLTKDKKKALDNYKQRVTESDAVFIIQPKGVTPNEASDLKKKLSASNATFNVVKNTLFKIALKDANIDLNLDEGENAAIFAKGDFSVVAKDIDEFISETEEAEFRTGIVQNSVITKEQFVTLSNLPSREVLLAQVLATMQGPISGFVRVLNGNLSGFVNVVNALKEQRA